MTEKSRKKKNLKKHLLLSNAHLQRLNKVNKKFQRDDEYQIAHNHYNPNSSQNNLKGV